MEVFRNLGLLTRINLIIALILLVFFGLATFFTYRQQREFTMREAVEKSRIIAYEAIRTREYLSRQYDIGEVQLSEERYGLIPVVAANRIGEQVASDLDYRIRQISDRYRNPKNAPDEFESRMLQRFYDNPYINEVYSITGIDGQQVFRYLRSFTVEQSCLRCHGDPEEAPDYIQALFPEETDQAYNYRIGEVIGAASVTIPMETLSAQIRTNLINEIAFSAGIFLALITALGMLIRYTVTRPLGELGQVIRDIVYTGRFEEKIPRRSRDEIGTLILGFNEMIDHLGEKTRHLEESESRFRLLTENARDAIVSFLGNGQIILFNRQAERLFGYSKREALGMPIDQLIHEDCTSIHELGPERYLIQEGRLLLSRTQMIPGRQRDGSKLLLELSLSVADSEGHLFYTAILREPHPCETGEGGESLRV